MYGCIYKQCTCVYLYVCISTQRTGWELRTIDQQIEELLHSDISCSIALPRLPKRVALEDSKLLKGARISVLDEDWDVSAHRRVYYTAAVEYLSWCAPV